jgi:hypothetical protein
MIDRLRLPVADRQQLSAEKTTKQVGAIHRRVLQTPDKHTPFADLRPLPAMAPAQ